MGTGLYPLIDGEMLIKPGNYFNYSKMELKIIGIRCLGKQGWPRCNDSLPAASYQLFPVASPLFDFPDTVS
jgi:hypothetical protein